MGILLLLPLRAEANALAIGWNEQHISVRVTAEEVSWRDAQGIHVQQWPGGGTLTLELVTPRASLAIVDNPSVAVWLQRAFLHRYPTRVVRLGLNTSLVLLDRDVEILWAIETAFVPLPAADFPAWLALTTPHGTTLYTRDSSVRLTGSDKPVKVEGSALRGTVVFNPNRRGLLTSINVLPLEDYLLGVVPNEMPAAWPLDALKAQALAARSYAVRQRRRHGEDGFDLCSTVHCQAYRGKDSEHSRSTQAVLETRGQVITYDGAVIDAVYHAHAGGHTRNSEQVWGGVAPYLRGVPIPEEPPLTWTHRVTVGEFERRLRAREVNITHVTEVSIAEHADAGHVRSVRVTSLLGTVDVLATSLRGALDRAEMRSTKFDIILLDHLMLPLRDSPAHAPFRLEVGRLAGIYYGLLPTQPAIIAFKGAGFGHGVGMSQWGAFGLARAGVNYRDIIRRFYSGVTISTVR